MCTCVPTTQVENNFVDSTQNNPIISIYAVAGMQPCLCAQAYQNSEYISYPKDFVPLTDSLKELKYVIELRVSGDSIKNNGYGLILSSIYDFKKKQWVTDRDSLKNQELDKFKQFFADSILLKVVQQYKNKLPDTLLFRNKAKTIEIELE